MHWKAEPFEDSPSEQGGQGGLELRHLKAFQQVYIARDYTAAGHDLHSSRKGVLRMIDRLEKTFHCALFTEEERGVLVPSPFADRLFNDLRFLNAAQESLEERVRLLRDSGRLLRIGSSSPVFRTQVFRNLFRNLQTSDQVRPSYVPTKPEDAAKVLSSGACDLHVGCWTAPSKRFISMEIGRVPFRMFIRGGAAAVDPSAAPYLVTMDGLDPETSGEIPAGKPAFRALPEVRFIHWLDHPEECPPGTRILGPDIPCNLRHWAVEVAPAAPHATIRINFLRQHPYEFLENLGRGLQQGMGAR